MAKDRSPVRIFGLDNDRPYAEEVVRHLRESGWQFAPDGTDPEGFHRLARHQCVDFTDHECLAWAAENIRKTHVIIFSSLFTDDKRSVNDKLIKALFFIASLKDASASEVTLVARFLPYGRQDRKDKPRKPVATKYRAQLFAAMGVSRVISLDVHDPAAEQNAPWGCPTDWLEARKPLADVVARLVDDPGKLTVVSPDVGGVDRTQKMQHSLGKRLKRRVAYAQFRKQHEEEQETVSGDEMLGDVEGRECWMVDDMAGTCGTVKVVREAVEKRHGRLAGVVVTHGLFTTDKHGEPAWKKLVGIPHVVVADSVDPYRLRDTPVWDNVTVVSTTALFAEVIRRTEMGGSLGALLED